MGGNACEKVLSGAHPSREIFFSELPWMQGGNSPDHQLVLEPLLLLLFVRQIYIRKAEHLEKVQAQTELQISAWVQQMTQEIAFSSQGPVFACSALRHTRRIGNPAHAGQPVPPWLPAEVAGRDAAATSPSCVPVCSSRAGFPEAAVCV